MTPPLRTLVVAAMISALRLTAPAPASGQDAPGKPGERPSLYPSGYLGHEALTAALRRAVEANPARLKLESLGKSLEGRDVWLVTVGTPDPFRPAILVTANLEGDHVVGSQVALRMAERFAAAEGPTAAWLDRVTVYLVPRLNPDGAERSLGRVAGRPLAEARGNARRLDRDRDGREAEDGPDDLDGDGIVATVRHKNAAEAALTLLPDKDDPRILRKADAAKGERGAFAEEPEGRDDDGDGLRNEDADSGVNLARNWPHRWTEFDREAGFSPASEPEVHALIRFAFEHPEIVAVWAFGLHDSLREEPKKPASTLDDADLPLFAELQRVHQKAAAAAAPAPEGGSPAGKGTPAPGATFDGALGEWAYHQFGVVGLSSRLWSTPEIPAPPKAAEPKDEEKPKAVAEAKESRDRPAAEKPKAAPAVPDDGEARWLYWNDHVMAGRAFLPFRPFDHPDLGAVEIGGWRPGVRLNPPAEEFGRLAESCLSFLADLAGKVPALAVEALKVEPKGGGLYGVTAVVANHGYLPTALAQGVRTKKAPPVLVRLVPAGATIVAGKSLERLDSLPGSGGRREFRWLLHASDGKAAPRLEVSCPKAGKVVSPIPLD